MSHHGMTPHISGSSLSAQARYAAGTREILESYFAGKLIRTEYLIVDKGKLAGAGAHSYTKGDATNRALYAELAGECEACISLSPHRLRPWGLSRPATRAARDSCRATRADPGRNAHDAGQVWTLRQRGRRQRD